MPTRDILYLVLNKGATYWRLVQTASLGLSTMSLKLEIALDPSCYCLLNCCNLEIPGGILQVGAVAVLRHMLAELDQPRQVFFCSFLHSWACW